MLSKRLITGPLLVILLLGLAVLDGWVGTRQIATSLYMGWPMGEFGIETIPPGLVIFVTCCFLIPLASVELAAMSRAGGTRCSAGLAAAFGILLLCTMWIGSAIPTNPGSSMLVVSLLATVLCACFFASLVVYSWGARAEGVLPAAASTLFFATYLGLFLGFYMLIRADHSIWWIIGIIAIVKMCDTGAYFIGSAIGRHKLIPWLSPGKTWEGLAGGLLVSMLTAWGLASMSAHWLSAEPVIPVAWAMGLGLAIGLTGQAGDLVMSLIKRSAQVKDSSSLLPGLGGVMDVLDSPLLAAPVAWWLLGWFASGNPIS
ncbi:MAG: phosphatidate cytidylyltransferase [Planctomycetota bacterium]|nr:phosphatidate cytidylyltransferase [Planctomycetota bacterium]